VLVVYAKTHPDLKQRGITAFLVEKVSCLFSVGGSIIAERLRARQGILQHSHFMDDVSHAFGMQLK
jgi:alkylation response protein AidB-like acyl-CoA dehydrogenase